MYLHWGVDECLLGMGMEWTIEGSDGVCESDTLGFMLVCEVGRQEGPSLGILIE